MGWERERRREVEEADKGEADGELNGRREKFGINWEGNLGMRVGGEKKAGVGGQKEKQTEWLPH